MFITHPRPKKGGLGPPPPKKRKAFAIEEISFDNDARADYLTGFHKRKVQRQKAAAEVAAEKARKEKIAFRKQIREQRQREVEDHVQQVNEALRIARMAGGEAEEEESEEEWDGIQDEDEPAPPEFIDHEEEYIDEDKYTTVTVEAVDIDRDGMHRLSKSSKSADNEEEEDDGEGNKKPDGSKTQSEESDKKKKEWPKKKKKKFRYETKVERQVAQKKQKRR